MLDLFKMSLWDRFGKITLEDFGGKYIDELHNGDKGHYHHLILLAIKFQRTQLLKYIDMVDV